MGVSSTLRLIPHLLMIGLAASVNITVGSKGNTTSSLQYGIMFEEINHSGDGGLYAELIRNRAFQNKSLEAYTPVNEASLSVTQSSNPLSSALPYNLHVARPENRSGIIGFANNGWWGISVKPQRYTGSFFVRGDYSGDFTVSLQSTLSSQTFASVHVRSRSTAHVWTKHQFSFTTRQAASNTNNSFSITFDAEAVAGGSLDFNLISLFPPTYKNRANGLRKDLVEAIADLKPSFLRFPGGGNIDGILPNTQYKWQETLGPIPYRPGRDAVWGYYETDGLGLAEFLQLCEDLEIAPVLAVWSGLNYVSGPLTAEELEPVVQDTLNELEFLTGSVETTWGAHRASLGFPKPWKVQYVEVGNEDHLTGGLESYQSYRLRMFYDAIKERFPDITIIASASELSMNLTHADMGGDFHIYDTPDGFVKQSGRFDHIQHQTLIGEFACTFSNNPDGLPSRDKYVTYPFWIGSVAEAVFLLGAERNSDRVIGAAYAPMLAHLEESQWVPTLLTFTADPEQTTRSTSYHVTRLLASNTMTHTLSAGSDTDFGPLHYVTGYDKRSHSYLFKAAVYNSSDDVPVSIKFPDMPSGVRAELSLLTADAPESSNAVGGPEIVTTSVSSVEAGPGGYFNFKLPDLSVAVLRVSMCGSN
ncbi:putative alpha-L-arabinofuranosidase [Penicillium oxalicum 114-2]|uniref:non-reducing end alpha-L-arabinofuranosidase n=1 Tax=Penicillium oxalicum (strain 114-2 / CGMCC 5302) TaxID=933388 RepID=S8AI28_PENO1|nr:putative alpha-L-arabinofuranosidase [Penicillium oxalicum 114-2]